MLHQLHRLTLLALIFLLSSCFEVREEVWIDSVGGGRMQFNYILPKGAIVPLGGESAIRNRIDTILQGVPELELDKLDIQDTGEEFIVHVELSTESMLSLSDLPEREVFQNLPPAASKLAGQFDVKLSGTDIVYDREINVGSALGLAAMMISPDERESRRTTYIIHLPAAAKVHNATRTENQGRTLVWDRTLGEALASPTTMSFVAPLPIPWVTLIAATLVFVVLVVLLVRWLRRRRRVRASVT